MKRYLSILLTLSMLMTFTSCSGARDKRDGKEKDRIEEEEKEDEEETVRSENTEEEANSENRVTFSTTDRDGNTFDDSVFADHDLTLINFWEPWCGPCVGEIPDLQQIYEDYSDRDLLILGVYSEETMEEDVDYILTESGVTYPILKYTPEFDIYQSGYVPTTILVDRNGNIIDTGVSYEGLDSTLIVGSRTYDEWEDIITPYLGE